jgi:hypothetical protein
MIASTRHARRLARASGVCMSTVRPVLAAFVLSALAAAVPAQAAPVPVQPAPAPVKPTTAPTAGAPASPAAPTAAPAPTAPPAAAPTSPPATAPAPAPTTAPAVQRPTTPVTAPATAQPAPGAPVVPAAPPPDPAAAPGSPAAAIEPDPTKPPVTPGLAEQLLGPSVNTHPDQRPTGRVPTEEESAEAEDAAVAAMYRDLYRPKNNPGRLTISARILYGILGSPDSSFSGRMGGLTGDIGQSFNKFGYALTLVAQFGNLLHTTPDRQTQSIALLGGGPTINLGRLGLFQRGMLDVRVGYDFLVAPTRIVMDGVAIGDGVRVPHGPRLALNMGLLTNPGRQRRLFHAFGFTIGYQALVHDLKGQLPFSNVLQFGMFWWGG